MTTINKIELKMEYLKTLIGLNAAGRRADVSESISNTMKSIENDLGYVEHRSSSIPIFEKGTDKDESVHTVRIMRDDKEFVRITLDKNLMALSELKDHACHLVYALSNKKYFNRY